MLYRKFGRTGENVSILGFGCMRFPILDNDTKKINEVEATKMLRYAIDNGVNYVDTAYGYHGEMSELVTGRALQDGYREKVYLATKLPSWRINTREDMDKYLNEQLRKLQTDYIDFYLLHGLSKERWENFTANGVFDFLDSIKKDGRAKYVGFSFHDQVEVFKEIVDAYDWSFSQIQFSFLDRKNQAGEEGLIYAYKRGLGVIIMSPLRGGELTTEVSSDIQEIWDSAKIKRTPAAWGLRYVWDYPEVGLLLSGMSTLAQVKENIATASEGHSSSLSEKEKQIIGKVKKTYEANKIRVNCTTCEYCLPCPAGVNIPGCFTHYNSAFALDANIQEVRRQYNVFMQEEAKASNCVECGKCEDLCPQSISIIKELKKVEQFFDRKSL